MIKQILLFVLFAFASIIPIAAQEYFIVRGTAAASNDLEVVDVYNGNTLSTVNVVLPNTTIDGFGGLTYHPQTKKLYTVIQSGGTSKLCTLNPITGAASLVGNMSDKFASITFTANGTLFGITADDALFPQTVYTINTSNGSAALFTTASGGGLGEALAFHSGQGLIYRYGGNGLLQTIDPGTKAVTTITSNISANTGDNCLAFITADDEFLFTSAEEIFTMTDLGVLTKLSDDDAMDGYTGAVLKAEIVGINEPKTTGIRVYPNPARDQIRVEGSSNGEGTVEIINMLGQTVLTQQLSASQTIDIGNLETGMYVLSIFQGDQSRQTTFVKE